MFNFKEYLKEEFIVEKDFIWEDDLLLESKDSNGVSSDDKGKMNELLLAKYLHPDQQLPEHHRSESTNKDHAGTPTQVHDRLKAKLDKTHKTAYAEIDKHSKEMAGHIMKHLRDNGHLGAGDSISNVFWTSNPDKENKAGDHEKTTGVKDVNSNGDVIVRIRDKRGNIKHVAISAKYGNNKPNYRNPGMDSMEKMAGLKSGSLSKHMDDHKAFIDSENYYTGSADNRNYQTKVDHLAGSKGIEAVRAEYAKHEATLISGKKLDAKDALMHANAKAFVEKHDSLPKKEQTAMIGRARARAAAAQESNQNARRNIATDLHAGFSQQSPEQLTELIRGVVSPKTHIPHIVAHSQTSEDGTAKHHVTAAENLASDHFAKFDMSTLTPHKGSGTSVVFKAKHKVTGKPTNVATLNVKSSSGPHKGSVGTWSLK